MSSAAADAPTTKLGFDPNYLSVFEEKLYIEGPSSARRLTYFFALLLLATIIATYGVLSKSSATVIGAMIVAPLMLPIMATTSAVVMGSMPRTVRAFALTVAGIFTVIIFSYLLAWVVPDVTISFENNGEIAARIDPGIYALLTALGAGAAGAFITSRAEIANSMGGVAIAISLVPPLCVVGVALQKGDLDAAAESFLALYDQLPGDFIRRRFGTRGHRSGKNGSYPRICSNSAPRLFPVHIGHPGRGYSAFDIGLPICAPRP